MTTAFRRLWSTFLTALSAVILIAERGRSNEAQDNRSSDVVEHTGNPVFDGWYADPESIVFGDQYWIYSTYSAAYEDQVFFDAFSSPDLVGWTKHERILDTTAVKWAWRAIWAPSAIQKDGRYWFFFAANDNQSDEEVGGIGVVVADSPLGPFDRLGIILEQDPDIATGAGHHSVIHVPGSDDDFMVYDRRPIPNEGCDHRATSIDRLELADYGTILPVEITKMGVASRPIE